jgi:hypothetical protein
MPQLIHAARRLVAGAVVALAMTVGLTTLTVGSASAAETSSRSVVGKSDAGKITSKVVGRTSNGDRVTGSFTPIKTVSRDGALYMKGFLQGRIKDKGPDTKFSGVQLIPIKKINGQSVTDGRSVAKAASGAAACDILNLVLGPLDLNLLGLQINLQRVVLDIVAVAGAGNLLGNLLCAVAGLLDGGGLLGGLLGQLQTLLNQILGLLNLGV